MTQSEDLAERLLGYEEAAVEEAVGPLRSIMGGLFARVLAWTGDPAELELPLEALEEALPAAQKVIERRRRGGFALGLLAARAEAGDIPEGLEPSRPPEAISGLTEFMQDRVAVARTMLTVAETEADTMAALSVAQQGVNRVEMVTATVVNEASNEAISEAARGTPDMVAMWRSERDACVRCLAYAGKVDRGDGFPKGLTFGKKVESDREVPHPPLHPRCRCRLSMVHVDDAPALGEALEREAKRSVLRGFSLPSESNSVRIDAARRLLTQGSGLPKSVKEYARKAVNAGKFRRGRDFPA